MGTMISLSQIGLYNPQRQSAELSEELFVARQKEFNELMDFLNEEEPNSVPQHHLIIASRGMGKTTLLKRIEVELHKEKYRTRFIPLLPPEEQYNLSDLTELWLNCLDELLESLETENTTNKDGIRIIEKEIEKIRKEYKDSFDLGEKLYNYLMYVCKQMKRRPVLLIDNIGFALHRLSKIEQNLLRGYLSDSGCPIVISAGVSMAGVSETKEHIINYKAPFYEFFQTHYLNPLKLNELIEILYKLSEITQIKISIDTKNRVYLQSLFQLTGGNPRTVVMLFKLLVKGFSNSIVDDLEALLDESTPLNKARFEELPTQQQIILNAIAQNWDPINLFDLSEATRYKNNQLSSQLNRLTSAGWITTTIADKREWAETTKKSKENTIKGNAYSISERFLAIWLIMRNGRRKMKNEIRKVLESYEWIYGNYNSQKTEERRNEEKTIITKKIKEQIEKDIKQACAEKDYGKAIEMTEYLDEDKNKLSAMSYVYMESGKYDDAEDKCREALALDDKDSDNWVNLGHCLIHQQKFKEAEDAFQRAIDLDENDINKWNSLFYSLYMQGKLSEAEDAVRKTVSLDKHQINNWGNLIQILTEQEKYVDAEEAILQLTKQNDNAEAFNFAGSYYVATEKPEEAEKAYQHAIELDKNNLHALFSLITLYLNLHRYKEVETLISTVKKVGKNDSIVWNNIGNVYIAIEQYDKAEKSYKKSIDLDENNIQAQFNIAKLYVNLERIDEAGKQIERMVELAKDNVDVLLTAGNFYVDVLGNKYDKAEILYKNALKLDATNPRLWFALNKLYMRQNRYAEAEKAMQKVLSLDKNNTNAWNAAGDFYFAIEKPDKAEKAYKHGIELDKNNLQARFNLSKLYINSSNYEEANKEIDSIVELDTNNNNVAAIGQLYFEINKYAEAENFLQQAVSSDNADDMSWWRLGFSLLFQEMNVEAEKAFTRAVEINNQNPCFWDMLGLALFAQKKYAEAENAYRQAVALDNDNVEFKVNYGICLSIQEKNNEAIELLNEVIQLDPNNTIAYGFLGDTYENINDNKKAIECYDKAIELNPNDATLYNQRGYSYNLNSSKAIADFSKAIIINPDYAFAYVNRGWVYTYGEYKDYEKAIVDYIKAIELDPNCNARKLLIRLYRDIKNEFNKAEELFKTLDATIISKDVYCLEQALFELHKRNEGIASDYLGNALEEIEDKLNPKTQGNWEYFAAITIKLGYAKWLLDILSEKGFDIILSPFYVAIQALEIERTNKLETMEVYLKNQASEKSKPARMLMEKMRLYL